VIRPRFSPTTLLVLLSSVLIVAVVVSAQTSRSLHHPRRKPSVGDEKVQLVPWRGPVEQLFFHPLVIRPKLAFGNDRLGQGFEDYFVTAGEFRAILDELWRNDWTLVDAHRAATGHVRVPPGRKPIVLYEDDVNYYAYFAGRGLASRLALDPNGDVRGEYVDNSGHRHLTTDDLVPLVDAAVDLHPEFSANGAKGVLALTGYEGLFGEHDLKRPDARARVKALAERLRATGWSIASHTFGHIDLGAASVETIVRDTARWKDLTQDLIGSTDLLVYPYGSRPTEAGQRRLFDRGFDIHADIDIAPRRVVRGGLVVMSRRHIDGLAFDNPRRLAPFFSVRRVRDPLRPHG
jgi:polysaccharide deacetylase